MGRKIAKKKPAEERTIEMFTRDRVKGVEYVPIKGTRKLVTVKIGAEHFPFSEGAIVRIVPDVDHTDDEIETMKAKLIAMGAAHVFAIPRPKDKLLPEKKVETVKVRGIREVVQALVTESAFEDKETLGEFTEEIMSAEGL